MLLPQDVAAFWWRNHFVGGEMQVLRAESDREKKQN
jgi:hypothetical protein